MQVRREVSWSGVVFTVSEEVKPSRLDKLSGQTVIAPQTDLEQASRRLLEEMESEWERDWSELRPASKIPR
jgi:hypothetical protein